MTSHHVEFSHTTWRKMTIVTELHTKLYFKKPPAQNTFNINHTTMHNARAHHLHVAPDVINRECARNSRCARDAKSWANKKARVSYKTWHKRTLPSHLSHAGYCPVLANRNIARSRDPLLYQLFNHVCTLSDNLLYFYSPKLFTAKHRYWLTSYSYRR
jgi:hypothetical protein